MHNLGPEIQCIAAPAPALPSALCGSTPCQWLRGCAYAVQLAAGCKPWDLGPPTFRRDLITCSVQVAITAARGRGKSAAVGLAVAGSLALGYSNVFVTAPSPENLHTLFQFILQVQF